MVNVWYTGQFYVHRACEGIRKIFNPILWHMKHALSRILGSRATTHLASNSHLTKNTTQSSFLYIYTMLAIILLLQTISLIISVLLSPGLCNLMAKCKRQKELSGRVDVTHDQRDGNAGPQVYWGEYNKSECGGLHLVYLTFLKVMEIKAHPFKQWKLLLMESYSRYWVYHSTHDSGDRTRYRLHMHADLFGFFFLQN